MCITVNYAALSKTKILSLPISHNKHFIAYSNSVKNESGEPNAMILAIPGKTKPDMFHDTTKYKDFLDEIIKKSKLEEDWMGIRSRGFLSKSLSFDNFQVGMYNVGLSETFEGVEAFINSLPENKRPNIKEELRDFFRTKYKGWSFAVCCFDSDKTIDAQPIAFEYEPFNADFLYFPSLDAHDGNAPKLDERVKMDHTIIYEHTGSMRESYVMDSISLDADVPDFLQNRKYRHLHMNDLQKNGDMFINIQDMNDVEFSVDPKVYRVPPLPYEQQDDVYEYRLNHSKGPIYVTLKEGDKFSIKIEGPISVLSKAIGGIGSENYANHTVTVTEAHLKTEASRMYAIMELNRLCQDDIVNRIVSMSPVLKVR